MSEELSLFFFAKFGGVPNRNEYNDIIMQTRQNVIFSGLKYDKLSP